ncbi:hypothetical protein [Clostridium guangxiense]|uniref:hypothetical protein n=1 Tax=Clostridium guangxiense TaxID=1662055 RepID=UPI001E52F3A6|nr:hypothetical protein [Clostridium guangxiense]MCD2348620.1 hypothetical protein [Clostridium guangxiense]
MSHTTGKKSTKEFSKKTTKPEPIEANSMKAQATYANSKNDHKKYNDTIRENLSK